MPSSRFGRIIKERLVDKPQAEAVFITTRKAKGQEYDEVEMLKDDFITRKNLERLYNSGKSYINASRLLEEVNVYYVAASNRSDTPTVRSEPFGYAQESLVEL